MFRDDAFCVLCGSTIRLQFHHRRPSQKKFNVGYAHKRNDVTIYQLIKEIAKCNLLCEMCHRKVHGLDVSNSCNKNP